MKDRIEARIEAALKNTNYEPSANGESIEEVDIPNPGLTIDNVLDHDWVKDAFINDDSDTFHVYVYVESQNFVYTVG